MIINVYIPDYEEKLINQIRQISENRRRSFSFVVREALESFLLASEQKFKSREKNAEVKE
jgi:hypothetical protein